MDNNLDLAKFLENSKKIKKVREDFKICFNSEIYELEKNIKILLENEQNFILKELVSLDIKSISLPQIGRLQTVLTYVVQENLDKYRTHILTTYALIEMPKPPERPEVGSEKTVIEQYNTDIKKWQEEAKKIKEWNSKYLTLTEWLESTITVDLYGDTTLNVTNLPYVYFKFFNTDIDEIEVFIQELKTCPAPPIKKIKRVTIEDISSKLPAFLKSANEVKVYFETEAEAEELNSSKDYVQGVYEKYVIKNDTMKKDGGEWGMHNKRKNNLQNPVIGSFNLNNVATPVNLNSGDDEEEDDEFYKNDYEVQLSDCYFAKTELNGNEVFAIVPKVFWIKYGSVLVNKNMFIVGISDNRKWRTEDMYFTCLDGTEKGEEYLNSSAEFSDDLDEYLMNGSVSNDSEEEDDNNGNGKTYTSLKDALKDVIKADFSKKDWDRYAEFYELTEAIKVPCFNEMYVKLSTSQKEELVKEFGSNSEQEFINQLKSDYLWTEVQDFENCDMEEFDDEKLVIRCGGDWQHPAILEIGLVDGKLKLVDSYLDI